MYLLFIIIGTAKIAIIKPQHTKDTVQFGNIVDLGTETTDTYAAIVVSGTASLL